MTRAERATIITLLALGAAGQAARLAVSGSDPPGGLLALPGSAETALARQRNAAAAAARPLQAGERIDPNSASVNDLARLPGVGTRLAKEIVSDREIRGPFRALGDLDRVKGIGPGALRRLEPFLLFPVLGTAPARLDLNRASASELQRLPGVGPARAKAILAWRERFGPFRDPADLDQVPGISAGLALRLRPLVAAR